MPQAGTRYLIGLPFTVNCHLQGSANSWRGRWPQPKTWNRKEVQILENWATKSPSRRCLSGLRYACTATQGGDFLRTTQVTIGSNSQPRRGDPIPAQGGASSVQRSSRNPGYRCVKTRIAPTGNAVKDFYPLKNGGVARFTLGSNPQ